jgi:hypothetical protein
MVIEPTETGYIISFPTRFKFWDSVAYASEMNGSGRGEIVGIDIDPDGIVRYTIQRTDHSWQPGILEEEIHLLRTSY